MPEGWEDLHNLIFLLMAVPKGMTLFRILLFVFLLGVGVFARARGRHVGQELLAPGAPCPCSDAALCNRVTSSPRREIFGFNCGSAAVDQWVRMI